MAKGTVFFFPEKFTAHSLTHFLRILFFFPFFRKKKQFFFFFPRKSLQATHSPKKMISPKKGQKRSKTGKKTVFQILEVFFFPKKSENISFFFFFRKILQFTHSIIFRRWKKKTQFSLTHSILAEKWSKMNFSREIKKYGTFAWINL